MPEDFCSTVGHTDFAVGVPDWHSFFHTSVLPLVSVSMADLFGFMSFLFCWILTAIIVLQAVMMIAGRTGKNIDNNDKNMLLRVVIIVAGRTEKKLITIITK